MIDKKLFKKGSDPQYTSQTYIVESVHGKTVFLEDGSKKKRNMLLKVHSDTISRNNITKEITREKTIERLLNKEGIDNKNIILKKRGRPKKEPELF